MASSSEIEKLERRYAENPEGRFFAPLADAYRKAGQVNRALELVRAGLQKHPDYLSAHIVLGRCLLDADKDAEAETTFRGVLELDSENIIALKSLAEIAERAGRPAEALEWLRKLLVVDSMNTEAEADLQRLGGKLGEQPTQPLEAVAAPPAPAEPEVSFADVTAEMRGAAAATLWTPAPEVSAPQPPAPVQAAAEAPPGIGAGTAAPRPAERRPPPAFELVPEPRTVAEAAPLPAPEPPPLEVLPFDDSLDWGTGERSSRAIREEDIAAVAHDETVTSPETEFISAIESAQGQPPTQPQELALEGPEERSLFGAAERAEATPVNAELPANLSGAYSIVEEVPPRLAGAAASGPAADLPLIMPEDVTPPEELARPSSKQVQMVSPAPVHEEGAAVAEPMLTETVADLYLKQGFRSEAVDVYRRLLSQRPGDAALAAKLRAAQAPPPNLSAAALGAESVAVWLRRVAASRLPTPGAAASSQSSNGPTPLEAAFSAPAPETVGEPAHPAPEAFSLEQIFGSAPEVPPVTAEGSSATPAPPPATGTSFDEFFGQPPGQGSVRPADKTPNRPSPTDDEDLGEFNAWLQSLKK